MTVKTRTIAIVVAVMILGVLAVGWYRMLVPLPEYRKGGLADWVPLLGVILMVYGGVLLGILVRWRQAIRKGQSLSMLETFRAGFAGALSLAGIYIAGSGIYGLIAKGSFWEGLGNLWGAVFFLMAIFGAMAAAGVALLLYGIRGPMPRRKP